MGTTKVGDFDIDQEEAIRLLRIPNPHGKPNSDVLRPFRNESDLVRVCSHRWIVDFGVGTSLEQASLFMGPFEYLTKHVKASREMNNDKWRRKNWWLLGRTLPDFRKATALKKRYIGTPTVAKHRIFVWLDSMILPDAKVIAIAYDDDYSFGILHSRSHELWTLANCGWHGIGNDATYNPTTCFQTFVFPDPSETQRLAIATAARDLEALRSRWLDPPEWTREEVLEFPGSIDGPWSRFVHEPDDRGIGTVRYPVLKPRTGAIGKELADRTLTNLYNKPPAWLEAAHRRLDEAGVRQRILATARSSPLAAPPPQPSPTRGEGVGGARPGRFGPPPPSWGRVGVGGWSRLVPESAGAPMRPSSPRTVGIPA